MNAEPAIRSATELVNSTRLDVASAQQRLALANAEVANAKRYYAVALASYTAAQANLRRALDSALAPVASEAE